MKLANKPCFPQPEIIIRTAKEKFPQDSIGSYMGLTFRERLIISLASNPYQCYRYEGNDSYLYVDREKTALAIISQADAIIKELEKEISK